MSDSDRIVRLRIELLEVEPVVWRVVEVPLTTTLRALHEVIQAAMPFENCHLYEFWIGEHRYGIPDPEFGAALTIREAKSIRLARFLAEGVDAFSYVYDFGDHWQHTVRVEAVMAVDASVKYSRFVEGCGRAPPENVGGTLGFEQFLKSMSRARSRDHKRMVDWYGGPFEPSVLDMATITDRFYKLARRRMLGKAAWAKSQGVVHRHPATWKAAFEGADDLSGAPF